MYKNDKTVGCSYLIVYGNILLVLAEWLIME